MTDNALKVSNKVSWLELHDIININSSLPYDKTIVKL